MPSKACKIHSREIKRIKSPERPYSAPALLRRVQLPEKDCEEPIFTTRSLTVTRIQPNTPPLSFLATPEYN